MQNQSNPDNSVVKLILDFNRNFPVIPTGDTHTVKEFKESLHYHNGLELGYCFKGSGVFFVNDKIMPFSKGDAVIIFQAESHIAQSNKKDFSRWKFAFVDVESLLGFLDIEFLAPIIRVLHGFNDFDNIVQKNNEMNLFVFEILKELEEKKDGYKTVVTALVWTLMSKLLRVVDPVDHTKVDSIRRNKSMKIVSPALNYLAKNYTEDINMAQLASICNLSVSHFRRVFTETMKLSPMEYLFHIRIKIASTLLVSQDDTIMDIALQVGYSSITSFNRHFKRIAGVPPKEWRNRPNKSFL